MKNLFNIFKKKKPIKTSIKGKCLNCNKEIACNTMFYCCDECRIENQTVLNESLSKLGFKDHEINQVIEQHEILRSSKYEKI